MAGELQREEVSTDELLAATAITRARVADDIAALAARLSVKSIETEAKQAAVHLWDAAVADVFERLQRMRRRVGTAVRAHPVPLLVVGGLSLGLLIWRSRRARAR